MAKVSLRVYNREIESMIEGGQLEEAVAHCQHILKTFPMHIETYRLLGKTFLEARRYGDAADIFQRVLMAVPDDFVAHVGMSIIHDDAGKLDDAIWHMERAFEVQPSNPAIQGELRRLYGRRDGVEPPKIRLSRDALANMYSQGELFNQAIAEIRSVLADDPNRPDLQVMLARAYYRGGQKVEAAEMAATLLKKYQYCMDALRILVDVLPGTARADNTQVYRQRLRLLDPYSSFVTGSVFGSDQVADAAVNLERLDFKPGAVPVAAEPNWASSLGIKLDHEKPADEKPAWLTGAHEAEPAFPGESLPELPASTAASEPSEEIPDWMRSSGWQESKGEATEGPVDFGADETSGAEPLAQADIPDWLQSMKPAAATAAESEPAPEEGGDFPDWLTNLGTAAASGAAAGFTAEGFDQPAVQEPIQEEPTVAGGSSEEIPDWLRGGSEPAAEIAPEPAPEPSAPRPSTGGQQDDTPFVPTGEAKPLGIEDDTFAWLENLAAKQGARPDELLTNAEERSEAIPDWLKGDEGQPAAEAAPEPTPESPAPVPAMEEPAAPVAVTRAPSADEGAPFVPTGEAKPLGIEDDTFAWLENLAAKQGARPDELLTNAQERSEAVPDWLKGDEGQPAAEAAPEPAPEPFVPVPANEEPPAPVVEKPARTSDEGTPFEPTGEAKPLGIEDDTFAWLESLAAKQGARPDELLTNAEERSGVPIDWTPPVPQEEPVPAPAEEPVAAFEIPAEEPTAQTGEDQSVSDWLGRLDETPAEAESAPESAIPTEEPAPAAAEGLPDWLKDMEQSALPPAEETPAPAAVMPDLPDWLRDTGPLAGQTPTESASQPEPAIPDWVNGNAPVPETNAPVQEPEPAMPDWISGNAPVPDTNAPVQEPEPEMPAWIDENAPVADAAAPVMPEEWLPADEKPEEKSAPEAVQPAPVQPAVQPPALRATGMLARIPAKDKDADILERSQIYLDENHLNEAMQEYAKLIKKGRLLDEVIHDLREAIYRFPVDVIVWQTLGDASMRANRLQDALDAYTKAEELLR